VLEDLGSSHRAAQITILLKTPTLKPNIRVTWNFRKANWTKFQDQLETKTNTINAEESAHKMLKIFCKIIQQSAKENIPRGKPRKYKPFWTQELNEQKKIRDQARQKAEKLKLHEDIIVWGKEKNKTETTNNTFKKKRLEYIVDKTEL